MGNTIQKTNIWYKFFPIDKYLKNSLLGNYLWFSNPTNFNDPYDLNITFDYTCTEEELREFFKMLKESYQENDEVIVNLDVEKRIQEFKKDPKLFIETQYKLIKELIGSNYGVCCFSEYCDNILMWSHYAEKHKGICLGFNPLIDRPFFENPYKVKYPHNFPKINFFQNRFDKKEKSTQFYLATKSRDWIYEEEIRVIKEKEYHSKFREDIIFNKKALVEVIFGYKVQPEQELQLIELINNLGYEVEYFKMNLKENEFGLRKDKR